MAHGYKRGIALKKKHGQHFLRDHSITHQMIESVSLDDNSSIFEIGCGDGFLTREIVKHLFARLWVFEIDQEWADFVRTEIKDTRVTVHHEDVLQIDFTAFEPYRPWTLLANLPYNITFPILHLLHRHRHLLKEGVVMIQEEVAQKILKTGGRGYGYTSLFFQHYFNWKMLSKIPPSAFYPPPKVFSRLLYFSPKKNVQPIAHEEQFWRFIKQCFRQPRRTLRNNLVQGHFDLKKVPEDYLKLRAQQMKMNDFLHLWTTINSVA